MRIPLLDDLRARRLARRSHDHVTFVEMNATLSEETLKRFMQSTRDLELPRSTLGSVDGYLLWSGRAANDFLDRRLKERRWSFDQSLLRLRAFLGDHFFQWRPGDSMERLPLRPDEDTNGGLADPQREVYLHAKVSELATMTEACADDYRRFRRTVRSKLSI